MENKGAAQRRDDRVSQTPQRVKSHSHVPSLSPSMARHLRSTDNELKTEIEEEDDDEENQTVKGRTKNTSTTSSTEPRVEKPAGRSKRKGVLPASSSSSSSSSAAAAALNDIEKASAAQSQHTPRKPPKESSKNISPHKFAPKSIARDLNQEEVSGTAGPLTKIASSGDAIQLPELSPAIKLVLRKAYQVIARQRGFAYGTPDSPIYGENTETSMRKAFHAMGLGSSPHNMFCDVGSGSGAPAIHAACEFPGLTSYGFELMGSRWWISQTVLSEMLRDGITAEAASRVMLAHVTLTDVKDFGPCTHVFSFDTGFPRSALESFAKALNASKHVQVLGSFQKQRVLEAAGFERLRLISQIPMKMTSSGEGHTLNVYHLDVDAAIARPPIGTNWNLPGLYKPPTDSVCAPNVPHGPNYSQGESARLAGPGSYSVWVNEQVGLNRTSGMRTRQKKKREESA